MTNWCSGSHNDAQMTITPTKLQMDAELTLIADLEKDISDLSPINSDDDESNYVDRVKK